MATELGGPRRGETIHSLVEYGQPGIDPAIEQARQLISDCDRKLSQHRAALEAGADPALVTQWMAEAQAQRVAAQGRLRQSEGQRRLTREEIDAMIKALGDLVKVLQVADPNDKAEAYAQMGMRLTYYLRKQLVEARIQPGLHMCNEYVSEGRLEPFAYLVEQDKQWIDLDDDS